MKYLVIKISIYGGEPDLYYTSDKVDALDYYNQFKDSSCISLIALYVLSKLDNTFMSVDKNLI